MTFRQLLSKLSQKIWLATATISLPALLYLAFGLLLLPELRSADLLIEWVANSVPLAISVCGMVSLALLWRSRTKAAGWLMIGALWLGMSLVVITAEGYGALAFVLIFLVASVIASVTLSNRATTSVLVVSGVLGSLIILLDAYWPLARVGADTSDIQLAQILTAILVAGYGLVLRNQLSTYPLGTRLAVLFLAIVIIPSTIFGAITSQTVGDSLRQAASTTLINQASQTRTRVDAFFSVRLDNIRTEARFLPFVEYLSLSATQRAGSRSATETTENLNTIIRKAGLYVISYALVDLNGRIVTSTRQDEVGTDVSERTYFLNTVSSGLAHVSSVELGDLGKRQAIFFAAPVYNSQGEMLGILRAQYDPLILQQTLLNVTASLDAGTSVVLVDENLVIQAHRNAPELIGKAIILLEPAQLTALQTRGVLPTGDPETLSLDLKDLASGLEQIDNQSNFQADLHPENTAEAFQGTGHIEQNGAVRLSTRPWYLVAGIQQDQLYAPVRTQTQTGVLTGVVVAAISVLFSLWTSYLISQPLQILSLAAEKVSAGDLETRVDITTQDENGRLASTFNQMTGQLNELITSLENRVTERTRAIETSGEISRRISTILDSDELVNAIVNQLQSAFGYYHVHIYLLNETRERLVMVGGSGAIGKQLLQRGHSLPSGRGLVGRAAETNRPVLVPDTRQNPEWVPNPLLPDTRAELAVPIAIAGNVLGVLDVQQNRAESLNENDAVLVSAIASQAAVALQNARAYAQTLRLAQRETQLAGIIRSIRNTNNPDMAIRVALRELGRVLGATETRLVFTEHGQALWGVPGNHDRPVVHDMDETQYPPIPDKNKG